MVIGWQDSSNVDQVINEMPGLPNASILTQGKRLVAQMVC